MQKRRYAAFGARDLPSSCTTQLMGIAKDLASRGWELQTGSFPGAMSCFRLGALLAKPEDSHSPNAEFVREWLPFVAFNGSASPLFPPTDKAEEVASFYHPRWEALPLRKKRIHASMSHILLGSSCKERVIFAICWSRDGNQDVDRHTSQGMRVCRGLDIPYYNLGARTGLRDFHNLLRGI